MNQLKDYLRRHNQNVTGKKAELALRAKGVSKLVKADVICGKAAASQFERRQKEKLVCLKKVSLINPEASVKRIM